MITANKLQKFIVQFQRLAPRGRFGPEVEVKERLHLQVLQRLSGLTKALSHFFSTITNYTQMSYTVLHIDVGWRFFT
jgi:hypothetical protein